MDEFALIQQFFNRRDLPQALQNNVVKGVGDDCAVLGVPAGDELVVSIDTMVEGVHFPVGAQPFDIGSRVMCAALSDLAAMGAKPLWFTLALTLPDASTVWLESFSCGLFSIADKFNCVLVGGDTTKGPLTLSVQVHGSVKAGTALLRNGAKPGDTVFVSHVLGDGAAALAMLKQQLQLDQTGQHYLMQRFYQPQPQIELGKHLVGLVSAAIDISDGLLADLNHICSASKVGAVLNLESLPTHQSWNAKVSDQQLWQWVLNGGDDYQLCFTVPPAKLDELSDKQLPVSPVGHIVEGQAVHLLHQGTAINIKKDGYNHFG